MKVRKSLPHEILQFNSCYLLLIVWCVHAVYQHTHNLTNADQLHEIHKTYLPQKFLMYLVLYESIRMFCQHVYSLAIDILSGKVDIHTQCVEMSGSIPRNVACRLHYSDIMFCDTGSLVPFMTFTFKQTLEPQCFFCLTCCLVTLLVDPILYTSKGMLQPHSQAFPPSLIACSMQIL